MSSSSSETTPSLYVGGSMLKPLVFYKERLYSYIHFK